MDFIAILKTVAPWIGTALGGPLGGMAVEAAANALGLSDKTTDALKTALSGATPEQMLALKKADQDFQVQMQALGYKQIADLEAIAAGDRKDARAMQVADKSPMPAVLTIIVGLAFMITLGVLFFVEIPDGNRDLIVYMCGQLAAAFAACLAFWVGTTRQSEDKTHMLAQAPAIKK
jgi:hypothetical protein